MLNLIIGKNSNLSQKLYEKLENAILFSVRDILNNIDILEPYQNIEVNIILNNFQMATKLGDLSCPENYIEFSLGATSKILQYIQENNFKINKIIYN